MENSKKKWYDHTILLVFLFIIPLGFTTLISIIGIILRIRANSEKKKILKIAEQRILDDKINSSEIFYKKVFFVFEYGLPNIKQNSGVYLLFYKNGDLGLSYSKGFTYYNIRFEKNQILNISFNQEVINNNSSALNNNVFAVTEGLTVLQPIKRINLLNLTVIYDGLQCVLGLSGKNANDIFFDLKKQFYSNN